MSRLAANRKIFAAHLSVRDSVYIPSVYWYENQRTFARLLRLVVIAEEFVNTN
jgi:UDP-glucose 4-epimerase